MIYIRKCYRCERIMGQKIEQAFWRVRRSRGGGQQEKELHIGDCMGIFLGLDFKIHHWLCYNFYSI